jgi:hypothetical protein
MGCRGGGVNARDQEAEFARLALANTLNGLILERLVATDLSDCWLVAGCLFQTVWNLRSGRPADENISDYDVFYFDATDLSWEAEDLHIRRLAADLRGVPVKVELRNQARVHLWYAKKFGPGYPQLRSSRDGIDRFLVDCTRVAIRLVADPLMGQKYELYAPGSLDDLFAGILRPNALNDRSERFRAKAESYRARWPWLTVAS